MNDLEMMKLCAEAMGYKAIIAPDLLAPSVKYLAVSGDFKGDGYSPLRDDAQAMALVKKFNLAISAAESGEPFWAVGKPLGERSFSKDLNRAIVECVAKMQASK